MTQASLLDAARSRALRDAGIAQVSIGREDFLEYARDVAVEVCHEQGTVTSDDLHARGVVAPWGVSKNIWGGIFEDPRFERIGYKRSEWPSAHRRAIRVWRLRA